MPHSQQPGVKRETGFLGMGRALTGKEETIYENKGGGL